MKTLGRAASPHGIKGGITFIPSPGAENFLQVGAKVTLDSGKEMILAKVTSGHKWIIYLEGIDDRNKAEELLPFSLSITGEVEVGEEDLVGMKVVCSKSGESVGFVARSFSNGVQTVLEIRGNLQFDIPLVDNFVKKIDRKNKILTVVVPSE